jgi:hypothetical protein
MTQSCDIYSPLTVEFGDISAEIALKSSWNCADNSQGQIGERLLGWPEILRGI